MKGKGDDMALEELRCRNCQAPLNPITYKCEYCGSQYEKKIEHGVTHYIQTCPAKVQTIRSQVSVPDEVMCRMSEEDIARYTMNEMVHHLAEALAPYTKIETEKDYMLCRQIIRGTIRVVEPDFRF
jgi:hypothetical protein